MSVTADEPVLVYGATGVQGGGILDQLVDEGNPVQAQTSNPDRTEMLEQRGAIPTIVDFDDHAALRSASEEASKIVLTVPQGQQSSDEVRRFGRNAIDAAEQADVELLVYNTSTPVPNEETDVALFEDRRMLEHYLDESEVPFVSLRPTVYMENLFHAAQGIVDDGVIAHPIPSELPMSWISAGDLGAFVTETLAHPEWTGKRIPIGGPDIFTGSDIAERFAAAMGESIEYQQIPLDEYEAQSVERLGPEAGRIMPETYRWTERNLDSGLFERDVDELRQTFPDVALTPLESWIGQQDWQQLVYET